MINPQDAWGILAREIKPLESHSTPLEQALGAYLAKSIFADIDIPPADRAAMDGYVIRFSDLEIHGTHLIVDGEIAAGFVSSSPIAPGHCLRIFTGANLPPEGDTVIAVENTSTGSFRGFANDREIEIVEVPKPGSNVFRKGENSRAGEQLIGTGSRFGARQLGLAVATGHSTVHTYKRPRIYILNTGAELIDTTSAIKAYQTRNSNGPLLEATLVEAGFEIAGRSIVPDVLESTVYEIQLALTVCDALIMTGGISAGLHDYVPQALESIGAKQFYRGVAMKPGKPQLFALSPESIPIFGLPGNPLSSVVGLYELVLPALRLLAGCLPDLCRPLFHLPLGGAVNHYGDRQLVLPSKLVRNAAGTQIIPHHPVGSADIVTGAQVDGAVLIDPEAGHLGPGEIVPFSLWGGLSE